MTHIELFGFTAAILTSLSYLPQALLILRTGVTSGISLVMYGMLTIGKVCWITYGLLVMSWPLICSQAFTLTLAALILTVTLRSRFDRRNFIDPMLA